SRRRALPAAAHLFVNGAEQAKATSADGSGTIGYTNATNQPFRIGTAGFDFPGSLNGKIAYLAVYKNRLLTTAELQALDAQLPIVVPPPVVTISLTNPTAGATYTAPATIATQAATTVSNGSITKVDFF